MFGLWCFSPVHAQTPISNLVFTVGTTIADGANQQWSYVVLDSPAHSVLSGKRFAIYGKTGGVASPNPFTLRGTLARQTDPAVIDALLGQSVVLGQNQTSLSNALNLLFRKVPGITNQTLPQKVVTAMQLADFDPSVAETLSLLASGNPGLNLCLGRALSEQVNSVTTYELRESHPITNAAGDVVGRVTVTPGVPVILPAPGRPFQVMTNEPSDHLRIRLRWGTPSELRRLTLLNAGFNLWRIPRAAAETDNFHVTPPNTAQLLSNPNFTRANPAPALATMDYGTGSGPGHADDPNDGITYFFADTGRATGAVFDDGEEFYYFVTARDLLGRDGLVSPGGLARACRRLPPKPPTDLRVENTILPGTTNQPRLLVTWEQNTNSVDAITHYWIYRWANPTSALTNEASPAKGRIAIVTNVPGTNLNSYIDTAPGALTAPNLSNVWYTIRSVSTAACDPLLSPPSSPAWGVLRERTAPEATTGEVVGSCGTPVVMFQNFATNVVDEPDPSVLRFRFTCVRRDPGIAWVQFAVTNSNAELERIGPVYFPPDEDVAEIDYELAAGVIGPITVGCIVGTYQDQISRVATCVFNPVPNFFTDQREAVFFAGQVLASAISLDDPFVIALSNGQTDCRAALNVTPDASGMVSMQFNFAADPAVLVQARENGVWTEVAMVTPDSNGVYWVSYPACLIGPVPPFRGCVVPLPTVGDCPQHVSQAADGGPTAPLRVRFRLTPRTREYRVYRRAGDGPMTLFAQGEAVYDPAKPNKVIEAKDEALPPSATRLCYFVQLLDEHGNGSPLSFIGCKEHLPAKLPRPLLAEPQAVGDVNSPQVLLNWFCPTAGVSRFEFKIKRTDPLPSGTSTGFTSTRLRVLTSFDKLASYLGLGPRILGAKTFDEGQLTPPIGDEFGPGPQFTVTADVVPNANYEITVAAVDALGKAHTTSEVWPFTWTPPVELPQVPWPARSLPPVRAFDVPRPEPYELPVAAVSFPGNSQYPIGLRIGVMKGDGVIETTGTNFAHYFVYQFETADPNTAIFRRKSTTAGRAGEMLLPIVAYRQQLTNAAFPRVSGHVVQVSPLVERIPWRIDFFGDNVNVTIPDRLFAIGWDQQTYLYSLYLRDLQPVLAGARYQYFLMRFNAKREPIEIVPVGEVTVP